MKKDLAALWIQSLLIANVLTLASTSNCTDWKFLDCQEKCSFDYQDGNERNWLCNGNCQPINKPCDGHCIGGFTECGEECESVYPPSMKCLNQNNCVSWADLWSCPINYRSIFHIEPETEAEIKEFYEGKSIRNEYHLCQRKEQVIESTVVCNGIIDCVDRSDESNCSPPPSVPWKGVFRDCVVDDANNFLNHSKVNFSGFECAANICLDWDIWCNSKVDDGDSTLISEARKICPDLVDQIESSYLCSNQSFWSKRRCNNDKLRCFGNYPGQCIKFKGSCRDKSDWNNKENASIVPRDLYYETLH